MIRTASRPGKFAGIGPFLVWTAILLFAPPASAANILQDFPFWKISAGWWESENTYFDSAFNYNIRSYNSLVHIEIDGPSMRETEYKFYAPSKLATGRGAGLIKADEGLETVTITAAELTDKVGTVLISKVSPDEATPEGMVIKLLGSDTAERIVPDKTSGVDNYRMFITLPTTNKRYVASFGIISGEDGKGDLGDLRGFSIFRATRVKDMDFERLRMELRAKNNVHAIIDVGPEGKPVGRRLD